MDPTASTSSSGPPKPKKNWSKLADDAIEGLGKEKNTDEDPNVGGDATLNSFFQKIYGDADEDTKRAMLKRKFW